jgi:hypothetical protein
VSIIEAVLATGKKIKLIAIFKGQSLQTDWFEAEGLPDWFYTTSKQHSLVRQNASTSWF